MKEYRKVAKFKFKQNMYVMYLDKNNKRFFLKIDDNNNLVYLTIEELLEITDHFTSIPLVMNAEIYLNMEKMKLVPKVIMNGVAVCLSLSLLSGCLSTFNESKVSTDSAGYTSGSELTEETALDFISIDIPLEDVSSNYATYKYYEDFNTLYIYDMDYLDVAFNYDSVSLDEINNVIANNNNIPPKFKNLLYEFVSNVDSVYANADLRVLYENLKGLEIVECDKGQIVKKTRNSNSYGCYDMEENKIYVLEGCEFKKHTWGYEIIMHEFSHCMRSGIYESAGQKIKVDVRDYMENESLTMEALNSLFAVSVLGYDEDNITYQLQSNYHKIMIDCMDNYSLEDYANHSLSYYMAKLDEFNGDKDKAALIIELMRLHYDNCYSSFVEVDESEFYDLYDYIANMYFNKHITADSSYEEAKRVADDLIDEISYGVYSDYNIDYNHFYDYLDTYCTSIGITTTSKTL